MPGTEPTPTGPVTMQVRYLRVTYRTPVRGGPDGEGAGRLRTRARNALAPRILRIRALRSISFDTYAGEMIGVVGRNGSGKSTLLRCLAGLETPGGGTVEASSQPQLLGVSAAVVPELTGLQNVRLGCLAMGLTPEQTRAATPDIVELSALGAAVHRPMRTYSSGMSARLRFAIAVTARPQILLVDEALSTGDAAFAERSAAAMREVLDQAGTVMLVTHVGALVQELCQRAIWLHDGTLVRDGEAGVVAEQYRWWSWNVSQGEHDKAEEILRTNMLVGDREWAREQ